ncbi:unnamed protein product [Allacma fusca]|uniref:Creatinase N-terminal domain-containing protein n=1 Tax=Allacma fusca TaxID=39272 RepID=A0A8J2KXN3_9HEXA|nr:unnamed protein product [Allacma fusca]
MSGHPRVPSLLELSSRVVQCSINVWLVGDEPQSRCCRRRSFSVILLIRYGRISRNAQPNRHGTGSRMCWYRSVEDKLTEIRTVMTNNGVDILVVSDLDEVAWLINQRREGIDYNPFIFAYFIMLQT